MHNIHIETSARQLYDGILICPELSQSSSGGSAVYIWGVGSEVAIIAAGGHGPILPQ